MRRVLFLALASALATPVAAQDPARTVAHYVVRRVQASPSTNEHQVALLLAVRDREGRTLFWAAERRILWRRWRERGTIHEWADGRTCPALAQVLTGVDRMPATKFAGATSNPDIPPFHSPVTTLHGPPADQPDRGAVRVSRSDWKGPVTDWWVRAEAALKPCWRATPPEAQGAPLRATLTSEEAMDNHGRPHW